MPMNNDEMWATLLLLAVISMMLLLPLSADADTPALCAVPGPHGEAIYCTDDPARLPLVLAERAEWRVLGPIDEYDKHTDADFIRRRHWWGCRYRYGQRWHSSAGLEAVVLNTGEVLIQARAGKRAFPIYGAVCP